MVEYSKDYNKIKNLPRIAILLLIVFGLFLSAYYLGFTREYCAKDQDCFLEKAATCSPAEVYVSRSNNIYHYQIYPSLKNTCRLKVTFERAQEGTSPEHIQLLEGKSMNCFIPKDNLRSVNPIEMENIMDYCSGPLKEGLYELIIKRMYELIVINIGEIAEEAQSVMKI